MAGWVLGTYWTNWRSRAMGEAEGDPGCHSSQCPPPTNKGLSVWVQGHGLLAPSCPVFHLCSCFPTRPADCLCVDLLCFLRWTNFPEGTSQFVDAWGFFFRDSTSSLSAKGLRMSLPKLPRLILDIGEEFVKNIAFCVTEHCNTESIWYFKSTKFHYLYAQYSI